MRTQPRHSPCSRPGESQQETTHTQHSGWAAVPAWGAQPCALPQLAKGSLRAALSWLQHWHRDRGAVRPKVLSKEQTQAGGHSWGTSLHCWTNSENSWEERLRGKPRISSPGCSEGCGASAESTPGSLHSHTPQGCSLPCPGNGAEGDRAGREGAQAAWEGWGCALSWGQQLPRGTLSPAVAEGRR